MIVSHLKIFSHHVNRDLWPRQGGPGQIGRVTPLRHFCVSCVINFFPVPRWNFFQLLLKVNTICDEYISYWNNGMCLSNKVNGNTRVRGKKAPGTRIRVKELDAIVPGRRQAIIWTNAGILLIRILGTNFSEILGKIHSFSFKTRQNSTQSVRNMPLLPPRHLLPHVLQIMHRNPKMTSYSQRGTIMRNIHRAWTKSPNLTHFMKSKWCQNYKNQQTVTILYLLSSEDA